MVQIRVPKNTEHFSVFVDIMYFDRPMVINTLDMYHHQRFSVFKEPTKFYAESEAVRFRHENDTLQVYAPRIPVSVHDLEKTVTLLTAVANSIYAYTDDAEFKSVYNLYQDINNFLAQSEHREMLLTPIFIMHTDIVSFTEQYIEVEQVTRKRKIELTFGKFKGIDIVLVWPEIPAESDSAVCGIYIGQSSKGISMIFLRRQWNARH